MIPFNPLSLSWLKVLPVVALGAALWYGYTHVTGFIDRQTAIVAENVKLRRENQLLASRDASYKLRLQRRDDAIAASACAAKIKRWVLHPNEIPPKFNPFGR